MHRRTTYATFPIGEYVVGRIHDDAVGVDPTRAKIAVRFLSCFNRLGNSQLRCNICNCKCQVNDQITILSRPIRGQAGRSPVALTGGLGTLRRRSEQAACPTTTIFSRGGLGTARPTTTNGRDAHFTMNFRSDRHTACPTTILNLGWALTCSHLATFPSATNYRLP